MSQATRLTLNLGIPRVALCLRRGFIVLTLSVLAAQLLLAAEPHDKRDKTVKQSTPVDSPPDLPIARARIELPDILHRIDFHHCAYTRNRMFQVSGITRAHIGAAGLYFVPTVGTYKWGDRNFVPQATEEFVAFNDLDSVQVRRRKFICYTPDQKYTLNHLYFFVIEGSKIPHIFEWLLWEKEEDAQRFANAVNRLAYAAHHQEKFDFATLEDFRARATAWRNSADKPKLPEEVDRQRVLAEAAFQEKDFLSAVVHYDEGLLSFDNWPEGWFNAALIYGELKLYSDAADHMKRYLELAPDAPDARAAKEKMYVWEEKAKAE